LRRAADIVYNLTKKEEAQNLTNPPLEEPAAPRLAQVRSQSLPEQIADAIVEGVASGALRPGQRLIEIELAGQLAVSRMPLREALKTLEAQGIVDRSPHRGARIVELDETSTDRVCEVRAALEAIAARHAMRAIRNEQASTRGLEVTLEEMARAVRNREWGAVNSSDLAFHREICRLSRNDIVIKLWEALARHVLMIFGREILGEKAQTKIVQQHRDLLDFLRAGDPQSLDDIVEHHIMRLRRQSRQAARPAGGLNAPAD
jgi:DNA-binding GntR family transcriptional regulator